MFLTNLDLELLHKNVVCYGWHVTRSMKMMKCFVINVAFLSPYILLAKPKATLTVKCWLQFLNCPQNNRSSTDLKLVLDLGEIPLCENNRAVGPQALT